MRGMIMAKRHESLAIRRGQNMRKARMEAYERARSKPPMMCPHCNSVEYIDPIGNRCLGCNTEIKNNFG